MDKNHRRLIKRIRELAEQRRMPISHLPDRAGVGRSHFWGVLAGKKSPTLKWMGQIAKALECDVADLLKPESTK